MSATAAEPEASPAEAKPASSLMTRLTYALLVGGFLLAALSAYILITNAQELSAARHELEEAQKDRDLVRAQADRVQRDMNLARAGTMYLIDSMESSQDFLEDQEIRVRLLCGQTSAGDPAAQQQSVRSEGDGMNIGSRYNDADFITFCRAFSERANWRRASNAVAMQRATATSDANYRAIAAEYQRLLPSARGDALESARMQEGLAYARLRLRQLDAAEIAVREARRMAPELGLPAITSLKIDCARPIAAEQARARLGALRALLEAKTARIRDILRRGRGANPAMERALRYSEVERRMVEQDPELYQRCAYAGLTPQRLPG